MNPSFDEADQEGTRVWMLGFFMAARIASGNGLLLFLSSFMTFSVRKDETTPGQQHLTLDGNRGATFDLVHLLQQGSLPTRILAQSNANITEGNACPRKTAKHPSR